MHVRWLLVLGICATTTTAWGQTSTRRGRKPPVAIGGEVAPYDGSINPTPKIHPLAEAGTIWLLKMQQADGGWPRVGRFGLGHEERAPSDYSTSSMAGLALVRTGATPAAKEQNPLRKAIRYVTDVATAAEPPDRDGSQPSYKLGPLAGPAHATHFLARVLPMLPADDPLRQAVTAALEKSVTRLEKAEHAFLQGGVEAATPAGSESESTIVEPPRPAAARAARDAMAKARPRGAAARDEPAPSIAMQQALVKRLAAGDERLLIGFGSLGGEEFLSYLLIAESLVLDGDPRIYGEWHKALVARLARSRNADGSWTGRHCITDPIYMTAAAVQALTADRDEPLLVHIAQQAIAEPAAVAAE